VKHIVTEHERPLVFTDRAMTETSAELAEAALALAEGEEATMLREREAHAMLTAPQAAPPVPHTPRRAIASGNQLPVRREERFEVRPIEPDDDDELTAIAGMLFGKKAELPYRSAPVTPPVTPPREPEER